jgi:hypothetical protein
MAETSGSPPQGVQFPLVNGRRSTSATGREVFAAAAAAIDTDLAARIGDAPRWHETYVDLLRDLVEADLVQATTDPDAVARAGLAALDATFTYDREGVSVPVTEVWSVAPAFELATATVRGRGGPVTEVVVPLGDHELRGDSLKRQLGQWADTGAIEPSVADAVGQVVDRPEWLDLSDLTVLVLGAASEMGPLAHLARWGATLVPVDLPRPRLWERILDAVRRGTGRALVPVRHPVDPDDLAALAVVAGADVDTELPELAAWVATLGHLDVAGTYVYADGADNVRVSLAADLLTRRLAAADDGLVLAGLLTPTDVYAAPIEAVTAARERLASRGPAPRLVHRASRGRGFHPQYDATVVTAGGASYGLADGQVLQQGPNYALAKRLARWRFRVARADGTGVSANVAPATNTRSVTSNRLLAAAYAGAHHFGVEVFEPPTSTALMAALLVRDLRDPTAAGRPDVSLDHPLALFADTAAHGGLWRMPWAPRSVLPLAAVAGLPATLRR